MDITKQEAWVSRESRPVRIPDFIAEVIERVAFEARTDRRIDKRSGVSQRMPITVTENVVSNAERRSIVSGDADIVPRISDIYAALPAITGKIELEYEGELIGGTTIARELIRRASDATFQERAGGVNVDDVIMWFDEGGALQVTDDARADLALKGFEVVPGLIELVHHVGLAPEDDPATSVAACELVLEALVARRKSRARRAGSTAAPHRSRGGARTRISSAAACPDARHLGARGEAGRPRRGRRTSLVAAPGIRGPSALRPASSGRAAVARTTCIVRNSRRPARRCSSPSATETSSACCGASMRRALRC
jgi:hypothetical protein